MNMNSSYIVPNQPKMNRTKNDDHSQMQFRENFNLRNLNKMDSANQNGMSGQRVPQQQQPTQPSQQRSSNAPSKHMLFFSNYCKHSKSLLTELQKRNALDNLELVCIDKRHVKNNMTYIQMNNNTTIPLPPMINCVPTLCMMPHYEILTGNKIMEYFNPINDIESERNQLDMEPNPYCLDKETTGSFGVSSDNFSFFDAQVDELSASGNGGTRQMYNYASISSSNDGMIHTPQDEGREKKIGMSLEQLQQQRDSEI